MKEIIISSLQFLVNEGRVKIVGFVLMPNHFHLVWQIQHEDEEVKVQKSFLKYIAQQMKVPLAGTNAKELEKYKVKASDRAYQFWKRNVLSIDYRADQSFCRS
ncbi:MAG: hypothetical protein WKG06_45715 [Segetibacter sp.]